MSLRNVLILTDGRPGHQQLSEGIAAAILRRAGGACERITVRRRGPGAAAALAVALNLPPDALLGLLYGMRGERFPAADVIVSAGAETLGASVALARARRIPNIHYGSLRRFRAADFALVLTSYEGDADGDRLVFFAKPAGFDPDTLGPARMPSTWANGLPRHVVVAIGGSAPGCKFADGDWARLTDILREGRSSHGITWVVSNSRRTPPAVSDRVKALANEPDAPVSRFVDVRDPGAARLAALLGPADALLVTADSSSMVSEAIFARRPVLALAPQTCDLGSSEMGYRRTLADRGWMATVPLGTLDVTGMVAALSALRPQAANPLDALADLIAARVPGLLD